LTRRIDRSLRDAGLPALERSAWVEVDLDALTANAEILASLASPAAVGPVVKADGYGHGLEMAARCAVAGGASWLCVADAGEALRLREDGYSGRILVLYPVPPAMEATMARHGVDLTVGSRVDAERIGGRVAADGAPLEVHIEIDTGMTRGGVAPEESVATAIAIARGGATTLAGTWTHLAAPEDPQRTSAQLARFDQVLTDLATAGIDPGVVHASASGGLLATDVGRHDLVRPGLAFYGVHPNVGGSLPTGVNAALAVRAHPVRLAEISPGTEVGYAGAWRATCHSMIATLPIGYADGWSRASSPGSFVLVAGERAPIVGRISSDSLTVDVTGIPDVGVTTEFTLLGHGVDAELTADDVAAARKTISWEVLQQLGSRLTRVYIAHGSPVAIRPESSLTLITAPDARLPRYRGQAPLSDTDR
jgi:alanine racemase